MQKLLLELLSHLNSSVFVLLGILVVAAWTLFNLGKWKEKFVTQDTRLDKVEAIHDKVVALETKVDLIYSHTLPRKLVAASSPIDVTPFGKEISDKINAEEIFKRCSAELVSRVNAMCPAKANAYDIQVAPMKVAKKDLLDMATAEEINAIKKAAFDAGLLAEDILSIFGIYLRNHVLGARGVPVVDVDRHDPEMKEKA